MIFRKKKEILEPYSIEQCSSCNKTVKRKFKEGDYILKQMEKCTSCGNGQIMISKIFGEPIK